MDTLYSSPVSEYFATKNIRPLCSGLWSGVEPTLPFPNRVLKRPSADNTNWATNWDDRSRPEQSGFLLHAGYNLSSEISTYLHLFVCSIFTDACIAFS